MKVFLIGSIPLIIYIPSLLIMNYLNKHDMSIGIRILSRIMTSIPNIIFAPLVMLIGIVAMRKLEELKYS